jgi:hypothetical protein
MENPEPTIRGMINATRWTCKVVIDNQAKGTGVLILPHIVLTAWHVVRDLFQFDGTRWVRRPGAAKRLRVDFDDYLFQTQQTLAPRLPLSVSAHDLDWCPYFCPCHAEELNDRFPKSLAELEGMWDFALLRLAVPVGLERRWAVADPLTALPRSNDFIYILQHPAGAPQKIDTDAIIEPDASVRAAVPGFRFLHRVNVVSGSSGSPCFTREFELCGIHQGTWNGSAGAGTTVNRGVPIGRIMEYLDKYDKAPLELGPQDAPIWSLGVESSFRPVIGCDAFQAEIWKMALVGQKRLLVIDGADKSGKTFRTEVCDALLNQERHLKIRIAMPQAAVLNAPSFAALLCREAGAALPPLVPVSETNTTPTTWRKDELLEKVMAALNAARNGPRLVWIFL